MYRISIYSIPQFDIKVNREKQNSPQKIKQAALNDCLMSPVLLNAFYLEDELSLFSNSNLTRKSEEIYATASNLYFLNASGYNDSNSALASA